jgi:hypothetical protein
MGGVLPDISGNLLKFSQERIFHRFIPGGEFMCDVKISFGRTGISEHYFCRSTTKAYIGLHVRGRLSEVNHVITTITRARVTGFQHSCEILISDVELDARVGSGAPVFVYVCSHDFGVVEVTGVPDIYAVYNSIFT